MAAREIVSMVSEIENRLGECITSEVRDELTKLKGNIEVIMGNLEHASMKLDLAMEPVFYSLKVAIFDLSFRMTADNASNIFVGPNLTIKRSQALVREIEYIRSGMLDSILRSVDDYIKNTTETNQEQKKEAPASGPKKLVGLKDEAESLISSLMEETEELDFIAITGMPGIGKTTLASMIYRDERIRNEFPTRIWVDDDFHSIKEWCLNILKQCMIVYSEFDICLGSCSKDSSIEILNDSQINHDQLEDMVRACLEKRKYLLVMDGVWDADSLDRVTVMLPEMGKVLITSHYNDIARKPPHVLRFLNGKESWELLQLEVFGKLGECPEALNETGECIARNCDGLPLAIAAVGSSLVVASSNKTAQDLTLEWWKEVSKNVTMYVTDYGGQYKVFERLELSYIKLPRHLQDCFLYLGVFPEGHEIHVRTLARLWIAEGLVADGELQILEETADAYLRDLIKRNLVMVVKSYPNDHIKTCRLHKLIYGFCKYKAAERDLYQEIKMSGDRPFSFTPNCHRLCVYSDLSKFLSSTPKGQCVRSILYINNEGKVVLHPNHISTILECFKLLRVLECRCANFTRFPDKLSKLIHLKYLSLSCDEIHVIPETISLLRYLETLVVDTQSSSLQLKANIWKMVWLRHFVTKAAIVLAIRRNGKAGANLRTLTRLAPACCTEDVFKRVCNLKALGIRGNLADLSDANSLRNLVFLERLKLINESATDGQLLHRFLHPYYSSLKLKRLTLSGTYLGWKHISILGKIDGLEILKLKNSAFTGESWSSNADGFGRLGFLLIETTNLVSWVASDSYCFPSLKRLVLKKCKELQSIPSTLAKSLDMLDVEDVSETAVKSANEIKRISGEQRGKLTELKLSIRPGSEATTNVLD